MTIPIVEMRAIYKSFGPVQALGDVHLELMPGEVLGLVGDNSAGKSTLMKILTGAYQRDTGEIFVNGEPVRFKSPHESRDRGIEMIYQDFALCGNLDVGQNIFLGRWPLRFGLFVDRTRMHRDAREILNRLKVDVNSVYQKVESLSGGRQQSVAIARAISFNPKVVIFDEPTANLSGPATERLLETIVELKNHGVAQIIISHRLTDIFEVGDRVMVLKRGRNVGVRDDRCDQREGSAGIDRFRRAGNRPRGGRTDLGAVTLAPSPALAGEGWGEGRGNSDDPHPALRATFSGKSGRRVARERRPHGRSRAILPARPASSGSSATRSRRSARRRWSRRNWCVAAATRF